MVALLAVSCGSPEIPSLPPFPPSPPQKESAPKSEAELRAILKETCKEASQLYVTEGFPIGVVSPDLCNFKLEDEHFDNETIAGFDANGLKVQMLASSGKFVNFFNWAVSHANFENRKTPLPTKWTPEHAIEVASKFADIFVKPWGASLGKPSARSGDLTDKLSSSSLFPGDWEIMWGIQTPTGIPYEMGRVKVVLSEKYGPSIISTIIGSSQYEDKHLVPISENKALSLSRKCLDIAISESRADGSYPDPYVLPDKPTISLMVVSPHEMMYEPKSLPASGFLKQSKARLAWVVTYQVTTSYQYQHGGVQVYIDAIDGRCLCCSYVPLWA